MNNHLLLHLGWAAVALCAFLLGSNFLGEKEDSPETSEQKSTTVVTRISERGEEASSERKARISARQREATGEPHVYSPADLATIGEEFRKAKGPLARRLAFAKILEALTPENALELREQIVHLDHDSAEFREFHYAWGALAGETAVLNGAETKKRDMAATLAGWMSADPDAALTYYNNLDENQQRGSGMAWGAMYGLADNDPALAAQFALNRAESGDKDARRLINVALDAVLNSGEIGDIGSITNLIKGSELETSAFRHVAWKLSETDPASGVEWAQSLPEGDGKNHAVGTSFHQWAGRDPQAAATEIASITNPSERDAARYGYATRVAHDDPVTGIEWASTINDENSRNRALYDTARTYFRKDREAATAWLPNSGLPAEIQQKLTERINRKR